MARRVSSLAGSVRVVTIDSETTDFRKDGPWRENLLGRIGIDAGARSG